MASKDVSTYRSGVGKLSYLVKWSRVEMKNCARELSRFMSEATKTHMQAMHRAMKHALIAPKRGLLIQPSRRWDGNPNFEHVIHDRSDSDYAKDPSTRRSVGGRSTFLNDSPIANKSNMFDHVALSVTESELCSAADLAQDMLFSMRVVESMGLKVKKPMCLYVDNKGAKDLANNWSCGGRTQHLQCQQFFLRELKEQDLIRTAWESGEDNSSDAFTKNLGGALCNKHTKVCCGEDEHMMEQHPNLREGVRGDKLVILNCECNWPKCQLCRARCDTGTCKMDRKRA